MFGALDGLFKALFGDIQRTFTTLFAISILFCSLMAIFGDEQNQSMFKKWLGRIIVAFVVFLIAMPIINYFSGKL